MFKNVFVEVIGFRTKLVLLLTIFSPILLIAALSIVWSLKKFDKQRIVFDGFETRTSEENIDYICDYCFSSADEIKMEMWAASFVTIITLSDVIIRVYSLQIMSRAARFA